MTAASRQQQQSLGSIFIVAGVAGAGLAAYFRYPSVPIVWLGFLIAAWMEPPAILTGKKNGSGFPTPAHPGEDKILRRSRFYGHLKFRLLLPNTSWLPGWPVLTAWLFAAAAAAAAWFIPVSGDIDYSRHINAAFTFVTIATVTAARRANMPDGPGCPGTRISTFGKLTESPRGTLALAGAVVFGAAGAAALIIYAPEAGGWAIRQRIFAAACVGVVTAALTVAVPWKNAALAHWRMVCQHHKLWEPKWVGIKMDPAPQLTDHYEVGPAIVDEFDAPPHLGSMAFLPLAVKITPALGAGYRVAILEVPSTDTKGNPHPGTVHPIKFKVVAWPTGEVPDLASSNTSQEVAELYAQSAFTWTNESLGYGRPVQMSVQRLSQESAVIAASEPLASAEPEDVSNDGQPRIGVEPEAHVDASAAWASTWAFPAGPSLKEIVPLLEQLSANFGCEVLIDHKGDALYFGDLTSGRTDFTDGDEVQRRMLELQTDNEWMGVWSNVLKQDANPPVIQHSTFKSVEYRDARARGNPTTVKRVGFVTLMGIEPGEYKGLEKKIATARNASPFVAVLGWPDRGQPKGTRHPQAFAIVWTDGPVPQNPDQIPDFDAAEWILAGRINEAFDAARLARPEVSATRILTTPQSRKHIWEINIRLYGGVTLADVRGMAAKIKQELGVPWLRITPAEGGCAIFAGGRPETVSLTNPRRDEVRLTKLDWDQAFIDSKITGNNGLLPELTAIDHLPRNESVSVLDFNLPPGLDLTRVKAGVTKLGVATGNDFVDPRTGVGGASTIRLLVSEENPLPARVGFDFDTAAEVAMDGKIAFATGIEGEPILFDSTESPHALLAGVTGSGKSVLAQNFLFAAALMGADIYVIDPIKGGADFKFVEPYAKAFASTPAEASAVMKAVYAEVVRRKNANANAGVGSYLDLPEPPKPIIVLIDEFTSLMGQSPVPKPTDDPEMDLEREEIIADNLARQNVGTFSGKLAREARSAGVTLLLGTQKLTAKMLDTIPGAGDLKVNLARVLLGKASYGDRASALRAFDDAPMLEGDIPKGRGLWEPLTSSAMIMQTWFAPQQELSTNLRSRIEPLAQVDKTDLAPYLPKPVDRQDVPGAIIEPVVERHSARKPKFDLDDFEEADPGELDLSFDLDGTDGELEVQDVTHVDYMPDPDLVDSVIVLDLDGTISPLAGKNANWPSWQVIGGDAGESAIVSPEMLSALCSLGAPMVWLTNRRGEANETLEDLVPHMKVLGYTGEDSGWWKIDSLVNFVDANPQIQRVIWADDEATEPMPGTDGTFKDYVVAELDKRGVTVLVIDTDPDVGLLPADLNEIAETLAGDVAEEKTDIQPARVEHSQPEKELVKAQARGSVGSVSDDPFAVPPPAPRWRRTVVDDDDDPFA